MTGLNGPGKTMVGGLIVLWPAVLMTMPHKWWLPAILTILFITMYILEG